MLDFSHRTGGGVMKRMRSLSYVALCVATLVLGIRHGASAFPGITGKTNKSGGAGCTGSGCHGTKTGTFTISGPGTLTVGQTGTYTITFPGSSKTAANVAASDGTLAPVTTQFTVSGGELTFSGARNASTWQFSYTPTIAGTKTLYAACVLNGHTGTWNHAADFPVTATTLTSVVTDVPQAFSLEQNYPNPFNPTTNIDYSIAKSARVTLNVYTMAGTLVATLVNATLPAGTYRAQFDGSVLATGVYIYRLTAGDIVLSKKLVLLK
jgi:hypothetical protein